MKRDQQILHAAEELFYERGFARVGVDEIGKRAGVTGSGIYRHFGSKDEILGMLFDRASDLLLMKVGPPQDDPREELRSLLRAHVEFSFEHHKLAAIWAMDVRALTGQHIRSFRHRQHLYAERWVTCLDRCYPGNAPEDLLTVVRGVWALLMSDSWRPKGGRSSPRAASILEELALAGIHGLEQMADPQPAS
jgi:AcrR family transcriptional regulator